MEKMTEKELEIYRRLQAKAKKIEREKAQFLADADERRSELLERWGIAIVLQTIGTDKVCEWMSKNGYSCWKIEPSAGALGEPHGSALGERTY